MDRTRQSAQRRCGTRKAERASYKRKVGALAEDMDVQAEEMARGEALANAEAI